METFATSRPSNSVPASLLCMPKRLAATDFHWRPIGDLAATLLRPMLNLAATSAASLRLSIFNSKLRKGRSAVVRSVGPGLNPWYLQQVKHMHASMSDKMAIYLFK